MSLWSGRSLRKLGEVIKPIGETESTQRLLLQGGQESVKVRKHGILIRVKLKGKESK